MSDYDVIIIGARVAGSATATLLARNGLRVLAVDKAAFPSDTLSTHQVQLPGIARLKRWGLYDRIAAAGTPATRRVRFDPGGVVLEGSYLEFEGVDALYSPRRTLLDTLLVEAAREAGAEVREHFAVDDIVIEDGRVTGVRARLPGGSPVVESARIVVGADGRHSLLAKTLAPRAYHEQPARTFAYYTYWEGLPVDSGEMYARARRLIGAWPTNDGLVMTYVAGPIDEFHAFRSDLEANLLASLDLAGDLGDRARAATRAERIYGTANTANYFREPYGPGWALVGDAGPAMDPVTGQGISDALRDAELLANAITTGRGGGQPLETALREYQRSRDRAVKPMYDFTLDVASLSPPKLEQQLLFNALQRDQDQTQRFLGVLTGAVPVGEFFSASNLRSLIGLRGFAKIAASRLRPRRSVPPDWRGRRRHRPVTDRERVHATPRQP
jgi:flavin-dependent dehydrogenase